jgi:hypothetical protein
LNYFSGSQLWTLNDDSKLENRDKLWVSNETCVFKNKNGFIYIEIDITTKVLGITNGSIVGWEDYVDGNTQQLWIKGEPTVEGYFTLENVGVPMVLTAITKMIDNMVSESSLEIKGNKTMRWILH